VMQAILAGAQVGRKLYESPSIPKAPRRRWWQRWFGRKKAPRSLEEVRIQDHHLDVRLKGLVARWSVGAMIGQLVVADTVFVIYAWVGYDWQIEPSVILGWLSATVVEVIGIVVIIAQYLFPRHGHGWSEPKELPAERPDASADE
jgi:hypothetical protein